MFTMRPLLRILVAGLLFFGVSPFASGCSCKQWDICSRLATNPVVFRGLVVAGGVQPGEDPSHSLASWARLQVLEPFHLVPPGTNYIEIDLSYSPGQCDENPYILHAEVLVMANIGPDGRPFDSGCSYTRPVRHAALELNYLRRHLSLDGRTSVRGRIVLNHDGDGYAAELARPVEGASVSLQGTDYSARTQTGTGGEYEFLGVPPGRYSVSAQKFLHRQQSPATSFEIRRHHLLPGVSLAAPCAIANVGLWLDNEVRGKVLSSHGQPVPGFSLYLQSLSNDEQYR